MPSAAAVRRSSVKLGRFLHGGRSLAQPLPHLSTCCSHGALPTCLLQQGLLRGAPAAPHLVQRVRGFVSRPRPSEVITTTNLSVAGGRMTVNLPLPGLPGLTPISVPMNVPVRDLIKELMSLDKR